jgi:hypothetical protein
LVIESKPDAGTRVTATLPERRWIPAAKAEPSGPIPVEIPMNITAGGFVARG